MSIKTGLAAATPGLAAATPAEFKPGAVDLIGLFSA
jgi:hypothetical protein